MFTVANTDRGGKLRSVTFGPANDVELVKWTEQIRKAYITDGQVCILNNSMKRLCTQTVCWLCMDRCSDLAPLCSAVCDKS
jgi:site-specific recombinase XerD